MKIKQQFSPTIKMDKTFDFSHFLTKSFEYPEQVDINTLNHVDARVYNKGLIKTIIMAGNGQFDVVDSKYGFSVKQRSNTDLGLGETYPYLANGVFITHNDAPKLPKIALDTVIEWYRRITEKNNQEAQVVFYHNSRKQTSITVDNVETLLIDIPGVTIWQDDLFSYTPLQYNSQAQTDVAATDEWYDVFNQQFGSYIETHSHNSMDAFASGTDEANSKQDGFQLVFGHLNTQNPVMYSWCTMNEVLKMGLDASDLSHIINLDGVLSDDQLTIDLNTLTYDASVFESWDKQVLERQWVSHKYVSSLYNSSLYTDGESLYTDGSLYGQYYNSPRKTYISPYTRLSGEEEMVIVEDVLESLVGLTPREKACFLAGYQAKADNPWVKEMDRQLLEDDVSFYLSQIGMFM